MLHGSFGGEEIVRSAIVTGSSGYIGRNLIRQLVCQGVHVLAVYRNSMPEEFFNSDLIEPYKCVMDNIDELISCCAGKHYDTFYQLAWDGAKGVKRSDYNIQIKNVINTVRAADAAKTLGCSKFITVGTISELLLELPENRRCVAQNMVYAASKQYTHNLLSILHKESPTQIIWARLSNVFGGDDESGNLISYTINHFNSNTIPEFGPCNNPYDFIHIDDVTMALYGIGFSETKHDEYFIGRCEGKTLQQYITTVANIYRHPVKIGARADDGLKYEPSWFDNTNLVDDIGFHFKYTFEEGIRAGMHIGD